MWVGRVEKKSQSGDRTWSHFERNCNQLFSCRGNSTSSWLPLWRHRLLFVFYTKHRMKQSNNFLLWQTLKTKKGNNNIFNLTLWVLQNSGTFRSCVSSVCILSEIFRLQELVVDAIIASYAIIKILWITILETPARLNSPGIFKRSIFMAQLKFWVSTDIL